MRLARLLLVEILEHALRFYDALGTNTLTQLRRWTLAAPSSLPVPAVIMAVGIEPPQGNRQWFTCLVQVTEHRHLVTFSITGTANSIRPTAGSSVFRRSFDAFRIDYWMKRKSNC